MSYGKCCYCECKIVEESKYLEVEHFKHKDAYPNDVVNWDNLLPSCKRCNTTKGTHDVVQTPIVNPVLNVPSSHIGFSEYRLKKKTQLGKDTIEVLNLNDTERLVTKRFKIGEMVKNQLELCLETLESYKLNNATRTKNSAINLIKGLLREAAPYSEYSAVVSTILLNETEYIAIKQNLINMSLWTQDIQHLESEAQKTLLDKI